MKLAIVLGTRPEIIKMSPVIRACEKHKVDFFVLHTGQHYDYALDGKIFDDLELDRPKYNLGVGGKPYAQQIGLTLRRMDSVFKKEGVTAIIVQGDTNSVLAGALAGNKLGITVVHHEAGLRSHDLSMPEEVNRILTDHISNILFVPTKTASHNLELESVESKRISLTGNTVVDAVMQNAKLAKKKSHILSKLKLKPKKYVLVTSHRAENVDSPVKLKGILDGLDAVSKKLKLPVIFPIHPRTKNNLKKFSLKVPSSIRLVAPQGYLDFLQMETNAKLIITDSGGLQEEASILKVPCVTIRENTERPETTKAGMNILVGTDPKKILKGSERMLKKKIRWSKPFGDGHAGELIVRLMLEKLR